ncbi:Pre-mRNA-splicing regulator female-lethal(2)D [Orchesella cincta]|uniref:Pre-mRNA-splicing regulator female-lethal(2)D n=1 Tax=Orchesella cincta TaxID=48709 RepID=A0A1D2MD97_ORCCI|nr:Pre-mRNA-splicing regulator female-lethal(2)D [Orchesella cincta]
MTLNTGKRLMAKCRMLYQENEDLGKMITSGRLAKLESDLALQKSLTEEMKRGQSEMDDLVQELDEDVEGMQSTIFFLQQQLREKITSNIANSSSSQSSELLVNISELCAQCRAAQEKKQKLNQTSHANSSEDKVVKMEVENSIDEENSRTLDSSNSSDNERTFLNGESDMYSPDREQMEQAKLVDKRTRVTRLSLVSKQPTQVNLNAESTSSENNLGLSVLTTQCNILDGSNNSKRKTIASSLLTADGNDKASDEESPESDNMVKPSTKRTKLNSGNRSVNNVGQLQTSVEEARTAGPTVPTSSRNRNGAVDHS